MSQGPLFHGKQKNTRSAMLVMQVLVVMVITLVISSNLLVISISGMIILYSRHVGVVAIKRT